MQHRDQQIQVGISHCDARAEAGRMHREERDRQFIEIAQIFKQTKPLIPVQSQKRLCHFLVQAQEEERAHLARELHDNLSQHLTAILLCMESIKIEAERSGNSMELDRLYFVVTELMTIAHDLAWDLRPTALNELGLGAVLEQHVHNWMKPSGIQTQVINICTENLPRMISEVETTLYRVIQEALINIRRHSQATQAKVWLDATPQQVAVTIEDNGKGFDVDSAIVTEHLGLQAMRERLELVGGILKIDSSSKVGTKLYAIIPLG